MADETEARLAAALAAVDALGLEADEDECGGGGAEAEAEAEAAAAARRAALCAQAEFYFSDVNLPTDAFLLARVRSSKAGWVPLSVIVRFHKMRKLCKPRAGEENEVAVAAAALRVGAPTLEVSGSGVSVRRRAPLPPTDPLEIGSRTVVVENLPPAASVASLTALFGEGVRMVRLCPPSGAGSPAYGASTLQAAPDPWGELNVVSAQPHALVEFDSRAGAEAAVAARNDANNWRTGLRVRLVCKTPPKAAAAAAEGEGEGEGEGEAEAEAGAGAGRGRGRGEGRGRGAAGKPPKRDYSAWASVSAHKESQEKLRAAAAEGGRAEAAAAPAMPTPAVAEAGGEEQRAPRRAGGAAAAAAPVREAGMPAPDGSRGFGVGRGRCLQPAGS